MHRDGGGERDGAHTSLMTSYLPLEDKVTDEADDNVDLTSFSPALKRLAGLVPQNDN